MRIHYLQHDSFEDLASIYQWADKPGNTITCTKFYEKEYHLPSPDEIDLLIIMGGPMGVYEEDKYHWLKPEKEFIGNVVQKNKKIMGICLGAQLLAEVLGGRVYKNGEKEIGWFDIGLTENARKDFFFRDFPSSLNVFHWHGDTFDLPPGATHIAFSKGCRNQAFTYDNRIIGLQFHIEATEKSIRELAYHCREELVMGTYIQKEADILKSATNIPEMNGYMFRLLEKLK